MPRRNRTVERTFGIEIEAFGLPMRTVAATIADAGIVCNAEGYNHHTSRNWKVVSDGSIRGDYGFEVVSPILSGAEGLAQVRTVMEALAAAGAKVNKTTGLHVHIGARDFSLREFRNIAKNYIIFEDFFDAIMPLSRRANNCPYIRSNRYSVGGDYTNAAAQRVCDKVDTCNTIDEIIRVICPSNYSEARYHKLNLTAFYRHGTVEFRQHSGTVDADKAVNWIELLIQFVNRASITRQRPNVGEVSKATVFAQFFRSFKMEGELKAFFTARRRVLHHLEA